MRSYQVYLISMLNTGRSSVGFRGRPHRPQEGSSMHNPIPVALARLDGLWGQRISTVRDHVLRTAETKFAFRGHSRNQQGVKSEACEVRPLLRVVFLVVEKQRSSVTAVLRHQYLFSCMYSSYLSRVEASSLFMSLPRYLYSVKSR
jgi:hypothetical protein